MKPWTAEIDVTADLASALIAGQFPALGAVDIVDFGSGWDNTAFLVKSTSPGPSSRGEFTKREYVFRFPRRAAALPFFETELRVLGGIAEKLPIPIPNPIFIGEPAAGLYPWPFAGYVLIPGRTGCAAALTGDQRTGCARPLGAFLRALHAIPIDTVSAGPDTIRRLDVEFRTKHLREDIVKLEAMGFVLPANWQAIVDAVRPPMPSDARVLVHGDLYIRHFLVDDDAGIAGVIDWGDCHIGYPAIDLSIAHSFLPPTAHSAFLEAYGSVDDAAWNLARWRALVHTSMLALYAYDVVDADLRRECDTTFRYLEQARV